jgi:hypothetical protein
MLKGLGIIAGIVTSLAPVAARAQTSNSEGAPTSSVIIQVPSSAPEQTVPLQAVAAPAAQTPAPPRVEAPALPPVVAGQDGFAVQSANGDFRLQMGLLVHADGRFGLDDSNQAVVDTFAFRRLRPYLRGRFSRRFEF